MKKIDSIIKKMMAAGKGMRHGQNIEFQHQSTGYMSADFPDEAWVAPTPVN